MSPNPFDAIFSAQGGAILGAVTEALGRARESNCDCETCVILRAAQAAMSHVTGRADGDGG